MSDVAKNIDDAISSQLKEYYSGNSERIAKLKEDLAKVELEAYKQKIASVSKLFKQRQEVIKEIPTFWHEVIMQGPLNPTFLVPDDHEALKAVKDIDIQFEEDPRNYTLTFTFGDNKYFSDKQLVRKYTVDPNVSRFEKYGLDAELKSKPATINWKSDAVNLVKLKPRAKGEQEEYDALELGSFFHLFTEEEDPLDLSAHVLELWLTAHDIYARLEGAFGDGDDEDEDDEEDDDPAAEIDLEEEEKRPTKKRRT